MQLHYKPPRQSQMCKIELIDVSEVQTEVGN